MMVAGFNIGHNSSLTLMEKGKIIYYNEERKLSQIKHRTGIPYNCIEQISNKKIDKCYATSYDFVKSDLFNLKSYLQFKKLLNCNDVYSLHKPHHLTHLFKAYVDSGFSEARVFVLDGRGSKWGDGVEICTIYDFNGLDIKCLYKKIYNKKNTKINYRDNEIGINSKTIFEITKNLSLGTFYAIISTYFGLDNEEGKFMGLQSYGKVNQELLKKFKKGITEKDINQIPRTIDSAKTSQVFFELDYFDLVKKYQSDNMIFTGGATLNVVNNYKLKTKFSDSEIYFEPICGDEGNSIGSAYFHYLSNNEKIYPNKNVYLGQKILIKNSLLLNEVLKTNVSIKDITKILSKGEIVGFVQGKAEAGPRALGNRSLLLDPSITDAKDKMNVVKKRENFRPFACSILEEKYKDYFNVQEGDKSPHMMIAPQAKENVKKIAPSIVHIDNTCRVQTVTKEENQNLFELLENFKLPFIMNTSLNLAGYPIVETFEDILFTLRNSSLKYIYFADEKKLLIKNEKKKKK
jgi:carbamoyltransferase